MQEDSIAGLAAAAWHFLLLIALFLPHFMQSSVTGSLEHIPESKLLDTLDEYQSNISAI